MKSDESEHLQSDLIFLHASVHFINVVISLGMKQARDGEDSYG